VTVLAQKSGNAVRTVAEVSASARFENAVVSYVRYIGMMFWPSRLAPLYPHPGNSINFWYVVGAAIILLAISAVVLVERERRYLLLGWFWFLGTLIPMIGIVTVGEQAMADRFAYIPYIGLFIPIVLAVDEFAAKWQIPRTWLASAAILIVATLGCLTCHQLRYWHDDETLWRYTLSVTDRNYMAHDNLALALAKQGRADEALIHFRAANVLHKYPPAQILELAIYELRVGHPDDAIAECDSVLHNSTDTKIQAAAWSERGQGSLQLGRYDEAAANYLNALSLDPNDGIALTGSAMLALREGKPDLAVAQLTKAVRIAPSELNAVLLAQALRREGRHAEADSISAQVAKVSPDLPGVQVAVGQMLSLVGLKPL
jgi:tetratricopeptide (TPR) repeat protein